MLFDKISAMLRKKQNRGFYVTANGLEPVLQIQHTQLIANESTMQNCTNCVRMACKWGEFAWTSKPVVKLTKQQKSLQFTRMRVDFLEFPFGISVFSPFLGSSNFILCTFRESREHQLMHVKHDFTLRNTLIKSYSMANIWEFSKNFPNLILEWDSQHSQIVYI